MGKHFNIANIFLILLAQSVDDGTEVALVTVVRQNLRRQDVIHVDAGVLERGILILKFPSTSIHSYPLLPTVHLFSPFFLANKHFHPPVLKREHDVHSYLFPYFRLSLLKNALGISTFRISPSSSFDSERMCVSFEQLVLISF